MGFKVARSNKESFFMLAGLEESLRGVNTAFVPPSILNAFDRDRAS